MWHKNHLKQALEYSKLPNSKLFYFKHFWWAICTAFLLLYWGVLMIIHAFIPQLVGFTVIERIVMFIKRLKELHPEDPLLSRIKYEDTPPISN